VLIYLVLRIIWTFQCHKRFSVGVYILTNIMNKRSISGNNTEQACLFRLYQQSTAIFRNRPGGAANDKNCWKMNLLPFSKGYIIMDFPFFFKFPLLHSWGGGNHPRRQSGWQINSWKVGGGGCWPGGK